MARPRLSEPTRRAILETGAQLFREQGYHGTGLQTILDRVGVPKGSFYNYFASKEEFAAAVVRDYAESLFETLEDELLRPAQKNALGALRKFLRARTRSHEQCGFAGGCLLGNLGAELDASDVVREALAETLRGWRDRFARALALAQEQGTVRDDVAAAELADLLLDTWEGALIRSKLERSAKPLRRCLAHLLDDHFQPS